MSVATSVKFALHTTGSEVSIHALWLWDVLYSFCRLIADAFIAIGNFIARQAKRFADRVASWDLTRDKVDRFLDKIFFYEFLAFLCGGIPGAGGGLSIATVSYCTKMGINLALVATMAIPMGWLVPGAVIAFLGSGAVAFWFSLQYRAYRREAGEFIKVGRELRLHKEEYTEAARELKQHKNELAKILPVFESHSMISIAQIAKPAEQLVSEDAGPSSLDKNTAGTMDWWKGSEQPQHGEIYVVLLAKPKPTRKPGEEQDVSEEDVSEAIEASVEPMPKSSVRPDAP